MLGLLAWLSLAVALVAVVASLVFVALRGLELWRRVRSTGGTLAREVDRITTATEVLTSHTEGMAGATEKLDASLARLAVSRARLAVLLRAWREVSEAWGSVRAYVPREKEA
jgi:hypothetical protein